MAEYIRLDGAALRWIGGDIKINTPVILYKYGPARPRPTEGDEDYMIRKSGCKDNLVFDILHQRNGVWSNVRYAPWTHQAGWEDVVRHDNHTLVLITSQVDGVLRLVLRECTLYHGDLIYLVHPGRKINQAYRKKGIV